MSNEEQTKKTKVGFIPQDWEIKTIEDISDNIFAGATPSTGKSEYWGGGIPWMSSGEINKKLIWDTERRITKEGFNSSSTKMVPIKSVLIALAGQGKTRGTVAVNKIELCTNQSLASIVPNQSMDSMFLFYNLENRYDELRKLSTGDGGRGGLNLKIIKNIYIGVPPLIEQQKIASIISTWDRAIELKEKLIVQKKEQKTGLTHRLLMGHIRCKDKEKYSKEELQQRLSLIDSGEIPEGYVKTRIGILPKDWDFIKAKKVFKNYTDKKHNGELEVLSATQDKGIIPRNQIEIDIKYDENSLSNYKKVEKGDFVISLRSFQGGIEYSFYEGIVSPAYTVLRNIVDIFDDFYRFLFKKEDFIRRLNSVIYGIRDGKQIGYKDFSEMYIQYPAPSEQKGISEILSVLEKELDMLHREQSALKEQKKGLMQLLLSGKIRVRG